MTWTWAVGLAILATLATVFSTWWTTRSEHTRWLRSERLKAWSELAAIAQQAIWHPVQGVLGVEDVLLNETPDELKFPSYHAALETIEQARATSIDLQRDLTLAGQRAVLLGDEEMAEEAQKLVRGLRRRVDLTAATIGTAPTDEERRELTDEAQKTLADYVKKGRERLGGNVGPIFRDPRQKRA